MDQCRWCNLKYRIWPWVYIKMRKLMKKIKNPDIKSSKDYNCELLFDVTSKFRMTIKKSKHWKKKDGSILLRYFLSKISSAMDEKITSKSWISLQLLVRYNDKNYDAFLIIWHNHKKRNYLPNWKWVICELQNSFTPFVQIILLRFVRFSHCEQNDTIQRRSHRPA